MTHEQIIETELPTKAATREAIRTARLALREAERALRENDYDSMAMWAESAAGAASVLWNDAELRWNAAN
jgi:hypothetical protein